MARDFFILVFNFILQYWVDWELSLNIFFWFDFHEVIIISWSWLYILHVNLGLLESIQYVIASIFFKKMSFWFFLVKLCFFSRLSRLILDLPSWSGHIRLNSTLFNFFFWKHVSNVWIYFFLNWSDSQRSTSK